MWAPKRVGALAWYSMSTRDDTRTHIRIWPISVKFWPRLMVTVHMALVPEDVVWAVAPEHRSDQQVTIHITQLMVS